MAEGQVKYIITIQDDGTAKMQRFGEEVKAVEGKVRNTSSAINDMVAAAGGLIVFDQVFNFAKGAVGDFDKLQKSVTNISIALNNMGSSADTTVGHMRDLADMIEGHSIFGHTEVLDAEKFLLPFSAIRGKMRDEVVQIGADVSSYFGRPLQDSMTMIARAFSSPQRGLMMLRQAGIVFSQSQTKMLEDMANTGHMAEYQGTLMDILSNKFKGVAEAVSETGSGAFAKLNNQFTAMKEKLGGAFEALALKFMPALESIVNFFTKHTGLIGFFITEIGLLAGALTVLKTTQILTTIASNAMAIGFDGAAVSATAMWGAITLGGALAIPAIMAMAGMFSGGDVNVNNSQLDTVSNSMDSLTGALNPVPGHLDKLNNTMMQLPSSIQKSLTASSDSIWKKSVNGLSNLWGTITNPDYDPNMDNYSKKSTGNVFGYSALSLNSNPTGTNNNPLNLGKDLLAGIDKLYNANAKNFTQKSAVSNAITPADPLSGNPDYVSEPKSTNIITNIQDLIKTMNITVNNSIKESADDVKKIVTQLLVEATTDANIRTQQN